MSSKLILRQRRYSVNRTSPHHNVDSKSVPLFEPKLKQKNLGKEERVHER